MGTKILKRITNHEDRVEARVAKTTQGYTVTLWCLDANLPLPTAFLFKNGEYDLAANKAEFLIG